MTLQLGKGDVLEVEGPLSRKMRVLWQHFPGNRVVLLDLGSKRAWPADAILTEVVSSIEEGRMRLLGQMPELLHPGRTHTAADLARMTARWACIEGIVELEPDIYSETSRRTLIAAAARLSGRTPKAIRDWLRLYWRRGMVQGALLGDYAACGLPGDRRKSGERKLGRPRVNGDLEGVNVDAQTRSEFAIAVHRTYRANGKLTLAGAFSEYEKMFVFDRTTDPVTGIISHALKPRFATKGGPTHRQFSYWFEHNSDIPELKRQRIGAKRYDLTCRGLTGTSTAQTWGPGARVEIDATSLNVFLVSRVDGKTIIGRAILYIVVDVFTRYIVGIDVGIENASWTAAMMALANIAEDKVAYCRRYGIEIEPHEWVDSGMPAAILSDKGEVDSSYIETLLRKFGIRAEAAPAFRAELKAICERRFGFVPLTFKPFVPGYIDTDYRQRGAWDYRTEAVLDIDELTAIIIRIVLYYNNIHELTKYDRDAAMVADDVPCIPADLMAWGRVNRSGAARRFEHDFVKFCLLPKDKALVTLLGISFRGNYYSCPRALEEKWFDLARQKGSWKVDISWDPRLVDSIYVHDRHKADGYDVCTILERSRAWAGKSYFEVDAAKHITADARANRLTGQRLSYADTMADVETIIDKAKGRKKALTGGKAMPVNDIRGNRAIEKAALRPEKAMRLAGAQRKAAEPVAGKPDIAGDGATLKPVKVDFGALSLSSLLSMIGEDDDE